MEGEEGRRGRERASEGWGAKGGSEGRREGGKEDGNPGEAG